MEYIFKWGCTRRYKLNTRGDISYPQATVYLLSCLLNNKFLNIFRNFQRLPQISEDCFRLLVKIQRCFHYIRLTNLRATYEGSNMIPAKSSKSSPVRIWKIFHLSPKIMWFHMNFVNGVFSSKTAVSISSLIP